MKGIIPIMRDVLTSLTIFRWTFAESPDFLLGRIFLSQIQTGSAVARSGNPTQLVSACRFLYPSLELVWSSVSECARPIRNVHEVQDHPFHKTGRGNICESGILGQALSRRRCFLSGCSRSIARCCAYDRRQTDLRALHL